MASDPEPDSPYHEGERAVQARLGVRARSEQMGRKMIRDFMPDQQRALFAELPFVIVGSLDGAGRPWASLLYGPAGFVHSPDPRRLCIAATPHVDDPVSRTLTLGARIGLLGIELETRRRNRVNGRLTRRDAGGLELRVEQSFGNCPRYIAARAPSYFARDVQPALTEQPALSRRAVALIRASDTAFVASAFAAQLSTDDREGVDVSHRGGKPGFVGVVTEDGASVLTMPDFAGNNAFNTLGNLARYPRAGLLFLDFAAGDLLLLTCTTTIVWSGDEVRRVRGAERLLRFRVEAGLLLSAALPFRWSPAEASPFVRETGSFG